MLMKAFGPVCPSVPIESFCVYEQSGCVEPVFASPLVRV